MTVHAPADPRDKSLGAYYTERHVADALCRWAVRGPGDRVLDPAFGGGVFLEAAAECASTVGSIELHGVDVDPRAHGAAGRIPGLAGARLLRGDFFALSPRELPAMDAVVGNPPFIRFQRFGGEARARARERAREAGVEVGPLAGSWVAFLAHATGFLAPGGRLATVVPAELGHAPSARPLLAHLAGTFRSVTFVSFRRSLFPHLDQETLLLLCDGRGGGPAEFSALDLDGPDGLRSPLPRIGPTPVDARALAEGRTRLRLVTLAARARSLYEDLSAGSADVARLGSLASVESGYVTGANALFHVSVPAAEELGLPPAALVPALLRSRALRGLKVDSEEWLRAGSAVGYLVQARGNEEHPAVAAFLRRLQAEGVPGRYKARTRSPWYRIPRVRFPPLVLAATGTSRLALAANRACLAVPNTFHAVTPREGEPTLPPEAFALAWSTSLARLSVELEGHALGGGMLKLDPGEAAGVLLPRPGHLPQELLERVHRLLVSGEEEAARLEADTLLAERRGIGRDDSRLLAEAAADLRARRLGRS